MAQNEANPEFDNDDSKLPSSSAQSSHQKNEVVTSQQKDVDASSPTSDMDREGQRNSEDVSTVYKSKDEHEVLTPAESNISYATDYGHIDHGVQGEVKETTADGKAEDKSDAPESTTREDTIQLNENAQMEHFSEPTISDYSQNDGELESSTVALSTALPTATSIETSSELESDYLQGISNSQRYTISLPETASESPPRVESLCQMSSALTVDQLATSRDGEATGASLNSSRLVPELIDPALLRLIDNRLATMFGSSLSTLPPEQKENLLENVLRSMVGIAGNRLYTPESPSVNKLATSLDYNASELNIDRIYHDPSGIIENLTSPSNARVESQMAECASSSLMHLEDVSLEVMNRQNIVFHTTSKVADTAQLPTTTNSLVVNSNDGSLTEHLIELQSAEASGTSGLLNFVSSSTGLKHEVVCMEDESIMADTVVVSSEIDEAGEKTLHIVHHGDGQSYTMELEPQEGSSLQFSEMDTDRYATAVHIHELEADGNVSSTVDISDEVLMDVSKCDEVLTTTSIDIHMETEDPCSSMASDSVITIPDNKQIIPLIRPKRNVRKITTNSSPENDEPSKWCEDCNSSCMSGCTKHRVQLISDKPVLTRARASLPATYLSITKVSPADNVYGIFAKKMIVKRTQFGPVEGVQSKKLELTYEPSGFALLLETEDNALVNIATSDESQSNWMGFVRPAENFKEQNLVVIQQGQSLYYTTTRTIMPKTELKVGYSLQYAIRRGLNVLEADKEERDEEENSWPCFECNKTFPTSEELQHHLNEHDVDVVDETISLEDKATATIARKYKSKSKVTKKSKVNPAMKKLASGNEEYRCDLCMKTFPRQYSLQRHQAMHSGEKKYKCSVCEMKFTHVYNRNRHMRRHRAQNNSETAKKPLKTLFKKRQVGGCEWECTHCNLTFDNPNLLNLHTLTHAAEDIELEDFNIELMINSKNDEYNENRFELGDRAVSSEILQCPQCTQNFPTKKELIEHASTHGKMLPKKSIRGVINPAKPYKCDLCYKAFAAEDRLQRHMMVHGSEEEKPLQCCFCEKRFLNNSALACHVKVHSDEKKMYECPICKEEFDQVVMLKSHIRIHSISGYFTCPTCQKPFDEYNQIRKHIRIFHSDKKFPCDHCDKIFPRPDKLKLHMLRHSTHREFLCASCGKQFKRKDKLKEHMKRMHSMEREARLAMKTQKAPSLKKFIPKVLPTDYHRFIYKCHSCLLGFKRRGMLVNHLAKRHPDIRPDSVPELNLPILKTTRDYYCQYCEKIYKSSSKRKAHIMKQHPGAELPMSNRRKGGIPDIPGMPNPTYSQTVGSVTTLPHNCEWCHKQYASKAKLLQHQRKKHVNLLPEAQQIPRSHHRDPSKPDIQHIFTTHQITVTTQTTDVEFSDDVDEDLKEKAEVTEIYVDQDEVNKTVVVAAEGKQEGEQPSGEQMPGADLLTQAMCELTHYVATDYNLTRAQQPCASGFASSPSSSPTQTTTDVNRTEDEAIDQSQLGHLLGHYHGKIEHQDGVPISSSFIQQSWARTEFNDFSEQ